MRGPAGARLVASDLFDRPEWAADDHRAAFIGFLETARRIAAGDPAPRSGRPPRPPLIAAAKAALAAGPLDATRARRFFETRFRPAEVIPSEGSAFLTGYYEPELPASPVPTPAFTAPALGLPDDLVRIAPYPDRTAIETGALAGRGLELVWLDRIELFFAQIQGSARLRLPDGTRLRLSYAGRNGRPYVPIGRIVVEEGHVPHEEMTMDRLKAWLRANPSETDRVIRMNPSYVFFRLEADSDRGPVGAAGAPLMALRSIAVDRTAWSYGTPFFVDADLPEPDGGSRPFAGLAVAQDTGTAIVGPARIDLFFGSGEAAGARAGLVRHPGRLTVLLPRSVA